MEAFSAPFEFVVLGWFSGLVFHIALHFVLKPWLSARMWDFWSGPGR